MATKNQNFEMWQGKDKELMFTVEDADDISGATAQWRLADHFYHPAVVTKAGVVDGGAATVTVVLEPSDTESLATGTWRHQLRLIDSGGKQDLAAEGMMILYPVIPDN